MRVAVINKLAVRVYQPFWPGEGLVHFDRKVASVVLWLSEPALVIMAILVIDLDEKLFDFFAGILILHVIF